MPQYLHRTRSLSKTHLQFIAMRIAKYWPLATVFVVSMIALIVYLSTLGPTVMPLDSAELTTSAYSLGLMHGPGYSVQILLLHIFMYLPIGDPGYRANLFSALANVGSAGIVTFLITRCYNHPIPALVGGLSFSFCFYIWSVAVIAEVYTFQGLLLALLLLTAWYWRMNGKLYVLRTGVVLAGVAFANSPATVLWWPGLLILVATSPHIRALNWKSWLGNGALFGLGLMPLLYLPWRSAANPQFAYVGSFDAYGQFHVSMLTSLPQLLGYISGYGQFRHLFFTFSSFALEGMHFGYRLWAAFSGLGIPLGLWGAWWLWQRDRSLMVGLGLIMFVHALFFMSYTASDKDTMFLPFFLIWAILLGCGIGRIMQHIPELMRGALLLLPLSLLLVNWSFVNVSSFDDVSTIAQERLVRAPANTLYLVSWRDASTMQYYQIVESIRPDIMIINDFFISEPTLLRLIEYKQMAGWVVYSPYIYPALTAAYQFIPLADGYMLCPYNDRQPTRCPRIPSKQEHN